MDENASNLFRLLCDNAVTFPSSIVITERTANIILNCVS